MLLLTCNENRNTPLSSPSGFIKIEIIILDIKESIDKNPYNLYEIGFYKSHITNQTIEIYTRGFLLLVFILQ